MTPEQAQAIYFAAQQSVITHLCELDAQRQASQLQIDRGAAAQGRPAREGLLQFQQTSFFR